MNANKTNSTSNKKAFAVPSTHVVVHEESVERDSPQGESGLAPPVSSLLVSPVPPSTTAKPARSFSSSSSVAASSSFLASSSSALSSSSSPTYSLSSSSSLPATSSNSSRTTSQLEYVAACLEQVRRRLSDSAAQQESAARVASYLFPQEDLAYELQANYYQPKLGRLVVEAAAKQEELLRDQHIIKKTVEKPRFEVGVGDMIVTEDQLPLDALAITLERLGYNSESHLSAINGVLASSSSSGNARELGAAQLSEGGGLGGYASLSSFGARVDYVYRCLKSVELQKRAALRLKQRKDPHFASTTITGPTTDNEAYSAAEQTLMAEAMHALADELVKAETQKTKPQRDVPVRSNL